MQFSLKMRRFSSFFESSRNAPHKRRLWGGALRDDIKIRSHETN